ncbi:amidohydrolase family protein [Aureimonas populi]|uniref:Amidohydrolase family protein n=1 Tax=Aureimonas populi TaxID=1701758 RepID=A0ABW5CLL7_9HYPH|nr:amidohydrolase family protein [Aureimonas populi]
MIERTLTGEPPLTRLPRGTVDTQMHMYLPGFEAEPGGPPLPGGDLPGPEAYRKVMDWLGIDQVVITQGNAHQRNNANLIACLEAMGDIARGVAVIGPDTDTARMRSLTDEGVVGARIMDLPGGAVGLADLEAVDRLAADHGWMLALQFDGSSILDHESRLASLRSRWVLDHHGKFFGGATPDGPQIAAVRRLMDTGRCWFKFAGVYESSRSGAPHYEDVAAVARTLASHAPERIVWGTNWPHNLAKTTEDYPDDRALTDTVLSWFPDEEGRRRALVDNPRELFGFPPIR